MKLKIRDGQMDKTVEAQILNGQLWLKHKDDTFVFDLNEGGSQRRKKSAGKKDSEIVAPMPGKITKIFVQADQEVKKSQALIVMEAMKMEYTLKSDLDTKVQSLKCKVGDQVSLGQLLIEFYKENK